MMTSCFRSSLPLLVAMSLSAAGANEYTTTAVSSTELEARYTEAIEQRAADILDALDLEDERKAALVHDVIVNQYRALRARDAVVDGYLLAKGESDLEPERKELVSGLTGPLHQLYVGTLSAHLTPEQVETVKDYMTYNKVQVTFNAYCEIIPDVTDAEKEMILKVLKEAREEAMDAGSAPEKHRIFDRYKEQINATLSSNGHDVEKAFKDWEAKQG